MFASKLNNQGYTAKTHMVRGESKILHPVLWHSHIGHSMHTNAHKQIEERKKERKKEIKKERKNERKKERI